MSVDTVINQMRANGHRMTKARLGVLSLFSARGCGPLSAHEVYRLLAKRGISMNEVTAYRELEVLEQWGILRRVPLRDGVQRYEAADLPHHHHLVCTDCHRVSEVHMPHDLSAAERSIAERSGFRVSHHALDFYGTCSRCLS